MAAVAHRHCDKLSAPLTVTAAVSVYTAVGRIAWSCGAAKAYVPAYGKTAPRSTHRAHRLAPLAGGSDVADALFYSHWPPLEVWHGCGFYAWHLAWLGAHHGNLAAHWTASINCLLDFILVAILTAILAARWAELVPFGRSRSLEPQHGQNTPSYLMNTLQWPHFLKPRSYGDPYSLDNFT